MEQESEYTTIGPFWRSVEVTFWNEILICLFKGIFKRILIKSDFYRTAIDKNIKRNEDAESFYDKVIRIFDKEVKLSSFKTEFGRVKNKDFEVESDWGRDKRNENKISLYKKIRDFIKRMVNDKVNETKRWYKVILVIQW